MPAGTTPRIKHCGSKGPPARGCDCYRCVYYRSYAREWSRDQRRLRTASWEKKLCRARRWKQQNRVAHEIYSGIRYLAIKDGLWPVREDKLVRKICAWRECGRVFYRPRDQGRCCSFECGLRRRVEWQRARRRAVTETQGGSP